MPVLWNKGDRHWPFRYLLLSGSMHGVWIENRADSATRALVQKQCRIAYHVAVLEALESAPQGLWPDTAPRRSVLDQRADEHPTPYGSSGGRCRYCGGGKDMEALVGAGLMRSLGNFLDNPYFEITNLGHRVMRSKRFEHLLK